MQKSTGLSIPKERLPNLRQHVVGTYTGQTFSSKRYTIRTMQSNYHNRQPQQYDANTGRLM